MISALYFSILTLFFQLCDIHGQLSNEVPKNCTCVPYYNCEEDTGNIITDGSDLFDIRKLHNNECNGYFDVCCKLTRNSYNLESEEMEEIQECGYPKSSVTPWTVALIPDSQTHEEVLHKCGASLIHPQVAVTAAHCLTNKGTWKIQIGHSHVGVRSLTIHPRFNPKSLHNDIALLFLEEPVPRSEKFDILCIPPRGTRFDNIRCMVITSCPIGGGTHNLNLIKLPIIAQDQCTKILRTSRLGVFFQLHRSFICAGGEPLLDTCDGDGGNPLVCPISGQPGRYHQAGIVSWGIGCGENTPGVYVNLALFRGWIDKQMISNNFGINTYRY